MTKVDFTHEKHGETIEKVIPLQYYAFGAIPPNINLNSSELCKSNAQLLGVKYYSSLIDRILAIMTSGFYTPKTLSYRCAQ